MLTSVLIIIIIIIIITFIFSVNILYVITPHVIVLLYSFQIKCINQCIYIV